MLDDECSSLKSIADVAKELNLEPYVIRYWETQFPHIRPIRKNGKRLYNKETIELIKNVKNLLYDKGYTIKGAQSHIIEEGVEHVLDESSNIEKESNVPFKDFNSTLGDIVERLQFLRDFLAKFTKQ